MSFVVGDNGVITQSQKAKIRTEEEDAKEEIEMEVVGCYNDEGDIDLGVLNDRLVKKGGVSFKKTGEDSDFVELKDGAEGEEGNYIEELPVTLKYKDAEVEITGEYTGGPDKSKTASELTPKDDYGQFVDYGLDLGGDGKTTNDWKIFYTDDSGRIFLIAADYVPNNCKALQTAMDEDHSKMVKSTIDENISVCCEYWSTSGFGLPTYHCYDGKSDLNKGKPDGQCSFPDIFMPNGDFCKTNDGKDNHYYCSSHVGTIEEKGAAGNINSRLASSLQCTMNWKPFVDSSSKSQYAQYAIGGPTLEMWVASWNKVHGTGTEKEEGKKGKTLYANGNDDSTDKTGYYVGTSKGTTDTNCSLSDYGGYSDTLYFPHTDSRGIDLFGDGKHWNDEGSAGVDGSDNAACSAYWLASPSAHGDVYLMDVGCDGFVNNISLLGNEACRPVVSLKSNVKVEWKSEEGANSNNGYYEIVGVE